MRCAHGTRVGELHLLAADGEYVVVQVDLQPRAALDLEARRVAVELRPSVIRARNPDECVAEDVRVIRMSDFERDDLAVRRDGDPDVLARSDLGGAAVAGVDREPEVARRAIGEEHICQHIDVDGRAIEDVGQGQHGVAGDGERERCLRIDRDPHE